MTRSKAENVYISMKETNNVTAPQAASKSLTLKLELDAS